MLVLCLRRQHIIKQPEDLLDKILANLHPLTTQSGCQQHWPTAKACRCHPHMSNKHKLLAESYPHISIHSIYNFELQIACPSYPVQ